MTRPKAAIVRFLERHFIENKRLLRWIVERTVKVTPGDVYFEDGQVKATVECDTRRLQAVYRLFYVVTYPLRWLP